MRCVFPSALVGLLLLFTSACRDQGPITSLEEPRLQPSLLTATDAQDAPGFSFLPPIARPSSHSGTFDPSLSPVVEICEPIGQGCSLPFVAQFTTSSGTGSEVVRVDPADQHYIVNWHTRQFSLDPSRTYRIRVRVGGNDLGYADVVLVRSAAEARSIDRERFVPVVLGSTVPIRLRIEQGAVPPLGPPKAVLSTRASVSASIGPTGGTLTADVEDIRYTLTIPARALLRTETITMTPLRRMQNFPLSGGVAAGVHFEPDGLSLFRAGRLTIEFPAGQSTGGLVGFGYSGTGAELYARPLQFTGSAVSFPVTHFSGAGAGSATSVDLDAVIAQVAAAIGTAQPSALYLAVLTQAERELAQQICGGPTPVMDCLDSGELERFQSEVPALRQEVLTRWYNDGVRPLLQAAPSDDSALDRARIEFIAWHSEYQANFTGDQPAPPALEALVEDGRTLLADGYLPAMERAREACDDARLLQLFAETEHLGIEGQQGLPSTLDELAERFTCLLFEVTGLSNPLGRDVTETLRLRVGRRGGGAIAWPEPVTLRNIGDGGCVLVNGQGTYTDRLAPDPEDPANSALEVPIRTGASDSCTEVLLEISTSTWIPDPQFGPYPSPFDQPILGARDTLRIPLVRRVQVAVLPSSATVAAGATHQFTALVTGTSNQQVVWTTTQPGGSINGSGLFTAGPTTGTFEIKAISMEDPSKSGTAQVTIRRSSISLGLQDLGVAARGGVGSTHVGSQNNGEAKCSIRHPLTGFSDQASGSAGWAWDDNPTTVPANEAGTGSASGFARQETTVTLDPSTGVLTISSSGTWDASATLSGGSGEAVGGAAVNPNPCEQLNRMGLTFSVSEGATFELTGTCTVSPTQRNEFSTLGAGGQFGFGFVGAGTRSIIIDATRTGGTICNSYFPTPLLNQSFTRTGTLSPGSFRVAWNGQASALSMAPHGGTASASGNYSFVLVVRPQ